MAQNKRNIERAITHRRLSETVRRAEIRTQRAILITASEETGDSFSLLNLKIHLPFGNARTVEKSNENNL